MATHSATASGARLVRSGLGFFLFGVVLSFGIIAHYCVGANWPTGDLFLKNVTLWYACPWTLSVAAVQAGGLGMVALGGARMLAARFGSDGPAEPTEATAHWLCAAGLIAVFLTGYAGYFVVDAIWPSFYYTPVATGKNVWLIAQALSIATYLLGAVMIFNAVRRALRPIVDAPSTGPAR